MNRKVFLGAAVLIAATASWISPAGASDVCGRACLQGLVDRYLTAHDPNLLPLFHLTNGQTVPSPVRSPLTLEVAELFEIDRGKLDQIEAVLGTAPHGMRSAVWDQP